MNGLIGRQKKKSETLTDRPVERGASGEAITDKIISGVTVFFNVLP